MNFRDIILEVVRKELPVQVVPATVLEVNRAQATCDCQPVEKDAPELFDVRLRAAEDDSATGLIAWPAVGSLVLVGLIDNDQNTAFVVATSEVEAFTLSTVKESLLPFLQELFVAIKSLTVTTPAGQSGPPINLATFEALEKRLPNLLAK